ncbi:hypothetical protein HY477_03250 [Candidatus Uhrbacteria bacterium]|nr:hypothetical protein [Candidatus Uhrbacteria bacterium]
MKKIVFLFSQPAWAATFMVGAPQGNMARVGEEVAVNIGVDTEGARLNLFSAEITLPDMIEFVSLSRDTSVASIWVSEPAYNADSRAVTLIGGVPGGTIGRVVLATVYIRAKAPGIYNFAVAEQAEAYLNDGLGTKVEVGVLPWTLEVSGGWSGNYKFTAAVGVLLLLTVGWYLWRRRLSRNRREISREIDAK